MYAKNLYSLNDSELKPAKAEIIYLDFDLDIVCYVDQNMGPFGDFPSYLGAFCPTQNNPSGLLGSSLRTSFG